MTRPDYESMLVAELKTQCEQLGLPTSGKKATLIERLEQSQNEPLMISIEADLVETENRYEYIFSRMKTQIIGPLNLGAIIAIGLSMLMISSVLVLQPSWLGFGDDFDYQLIDFEAEQTRTYAEDLVELGHPEWEGRMSGTIEEANTSQYIIERLEEMGYEPESNEYQVPMHHVNSEPSFRLCVQGGFGLSPCDGPVGQVGGSQVTIFQHRVDYVIQGFSGQSEYMFDEEIPVTDLGNGSDESLWQSATGTLGYVRMDESRVSNTQMYSYAAQNDLAGIISVNKIINCGQIEGNDCVPIFKGTNYDSLLAANGGTIPTEIPFIAMSRDAGDIFEALVINATEPASIELIIDVTNDEERTIYVPCGKIQGRTSEVIIAGAHHDTVYQGQGAVDDSSGVATVLEMARQLAEIVNQTGKPERTIQFCTWGGEEEGLWGSRAYVADMQNNLRDNLRLYLNFDMNHVDGDFQNRGNSLTLFTNNADDYRHINNIANLYVKDKSEIASKYDIRFSLLSGDRGEPNEMPCNSDYCPFIYELGGKTGRAVSCYGGGAWEYHTYLDTMERFNEESLHVSGTIYGSYMRLLAYDLNA
ncbi:MAG: M28 family peptidase [Candidatus Thermoplasmatota archaeon]|nr:M28 family peptidase [Candidatus Thermoplasmatota archaeon]MEC7255257.1 M28 family peptidase [Candidatus Thermoplasmatota archaeon]MEC8258117.1 M28 family peptidase [Candidatus Thermoplasmatota archaeon]MEC8312375.1 M28 family peptidase [Candidatus Thermoplasmatota archaeon]